MRRFHPIPGLSSYRPPPSGAKPLPEEDPELWRAKNWGIPQRRKLADILKRAVERSNKAQVCADAVAQLLRLERPFAKRWVIQRIEDAIDFDLEKRPHANEGEEPIGAPEKHRRLAARVHAFRVGDILPRLHEDIKRLLRQVGGRFPLNREQLDWCRDSASPLTRDLNIFLRGFQSERKALAAGIACSCRLCIRMDKELDELEEVIDQCQQSLDSSTLASGNSYIPTAPLAVRPTSNLPGYQTVTTGTTVALNEPETSHHHHRALSWDAFEGSLNRTLAAIEERLTAQTRAGTASIDNRLRKLERGQETVLNDMDLLLREKPQIARVNMATRQALSRQLHVVEDEINRLRQDLDLGPSRRSAGALELLVRASIRKGALEHQLNDLKKNSGTTMHGAL